MHIYGKIYLTLHGFMLGETKSKLQKGLRLKIQSALEAAKELTCGPNDQLKWKSLLTYLFEDHCLSGSDILSKVIQLHQGNDKRGCVELLLKYCKTCRVAACLPVITLSDKYIPLDFDKNLHIENDVKGLVEEKEGCLDFDMILAHLRQAWRHRNPEKILTYMKLISACHDLEKRTLTEKGKHFLPDKRRGKPHVGQIALRMLYLDTKDLVLKRYIGNCYTLASITESPVRLILFSVVTHQLFQHEVKSAESIQIGTINWPDVGIPQDMADRDVDKHTFRGKTGKGSDSILKTRPEGMTDAAFKEFHGPRRKQDINDFFNEGVKCVDQAMVFNPFWSKTMEIYKQHSSRQQKTVVMTAKYMDKLKRVKPDLFHSGEVKSEKVKTAKRKLPSDQEEQAKKQKVDQITFAPPPDCPLLQIPNGPNKKETVADLENGKVWKGPFTTKQISHILCIHRLMKNVFGDKHTLDVEDRYPFVVFPLLKGPDASLQEETKVYVNYLQKKQIVERNFMTRKSMGLQQLHDLSPLQIVNLPQSVWAHFLLRFVLNIGDTGLYNAVTDSSCRFVYGIDMEENRGKNPSDNILDVMFVKKPSKQLCAAILYSMKKNKADLMKVLDREIDNDNLKIHLEKYSSALNVNDIIYKIALIKTTVSLL